MATQTVVTATQGGTGTDNGIILTVRVLTGAADTQDGATSTSSTITTPQQAITPIASGSVVYGAVTNASEAVSFTANGSTTFSQNVLYTGDGDTFGTFRSTSTTTASTPVTVGASAPTGQGAGNIHFAAAEILTSGTLAEDPSSPAGKNTTTATSVSTAAFTPPPGTLLVAMVSSNGLGSGTLTMTVSDTSGLTWVQAAGTTYDMASVWLAWVPGVFQPQGQAVRGRLTAEQQSPPGLTYSRSGRSWSSGRVSASYGSPPANPASGPVFRQRTTPAQARPPLPARGRTGSNRGAPLFISVPGPVFRQKTSPARIRPVLPPRGRAGSNKGTLPKNPAPGPVFRQRTQPAQARLPKQPVLRGRAVSNPGANPNLRMACGAMPGYVYPSYLGSYWNQFLASAGKLPSVVILNCGNGDVPWNSDYEGLCTSLHALGITVLGYTYTNYGTRTAATVEAAVGNYLGAGITPGGNGVDGIFLDEFQSAAGGFSYYSGICTSIASQFAAGGGSAHPPVWGNPGTYLDSSYLALPVSTFVTFESDVAAYLRAAPYNVSVSGTPVSGQGTYPRSRFCHLVYAVARDQVDGVADRAYASYAGYAYATSSGGASNPYYTIPGNDYLNDMALRIAGEPGTGVTGIPPYVYPQQSPARIRPSLPGRGRTRGNAGAPVYPYPQPLPAVSAGFWAVPGVMVPGGIWPGYPYSYRLWQFTGHYPVYYLDYLDGIARTTLYAQPGGSYLILVANTRAGLSVPPGDGRWLGETPQQDELPLHRRVFLKLRRHIHRSRGRSGYRNPPAT